MSGERPVLVAAGGTGGHVFPALAVIDELRARGRPVVLLTDARGRRYLPPELPGVTVHEVAAASPSGGLLHALRAAVRLLAGAGEAAGVLARTRPAAAGLFGGYAAVPALAACVLGRVPLLRHEQNAVLGRANRLAARFSRILALSFCDTERVPPRLAARVRVTGNPVRPGFAAAAAEERGTDGRLRLLVTGGSQGARIFGEVVPAALALLPEELRRRIVLWMQVREEQLEGVRAAVSPLVAESEVRPFFADLDRRLCAADLALTRAGASTVA
ncbi:UDP-N-acetylglucosamine--N-acetylmuramyl-(pentapeptide) pyrophosphoryl-undecaprenol N-acetylglucosamine transferase [bacterium HR39]|nr:UDP-N-acetylglucosamine--N-acetylmuramyl-(pentapeptide) pyrophosphoryl-undecaprenol N-acetylglucosamine transferase [bacterium HR39]